MKLQFCPFDNLEILKSEIKTNKQYYKSKDNSWIKDILQEESPFIDSKISIPDEGINLIIGDHPEKNDLPNIKIMYTSLKNLTTCQAADERVWVALSHGILWNYMQARWPLSKGKKDEERFILKNYFFAHGTRSLLTNGLARLWWFGKLTYLEDDENPFRLTEYICDDINGKGFPLLGSNFSNNINITKTFLDTIKKFEEDNKIKLSRVEFLEMIKFVNLLGGKMILDSLPPEYLSDKLNKKLNSIFDK